MNRSGPREVLIEPYCIFCGQSTQHTEKHTFSVTIGNWTSQITFSYPTHPNCLQTAKKPLRNILIVTGGVAVVVFVLAAVLVNLVGMPDSGCVIAAAALAAAVAGYYVYHRFRGNFVKNFNAALRSYYDTHVQGETTYDPLSAVSTKQQESQTLIIDANGDSSGQYRTIYGAINAAREGDRILVRPGKYNARNRFGPEAAYRTGPILINKRVEIIGDGPRKEIVVEDAFGEGCFRMQTHQATLRNLTLVHNHPSKCAVEVVVGQLLIEDCDITDKGLSCVNVRGPMSEVTLKGCNIEGDHFQMRKQVGVLVYNRASAFIENCDIIASHLSGIEVRDGGRLNIRGSKVRNGYAAGILVREQAEAVVTDCEIYRNANPGISVSNGSKVTCLQSRIYDGKTVGIFIGSQSQGTIEECDIYGNTNSNVQIARGSNPIFRKSKIRDGRGDGVWAFEQGQGILEDCDIFGNAYAGIRICEESAPTIRHCNINGNGHQAIWVHDNGKGTVEDCDLTGNKRGSWLIESGGQVSKKNNQESEPEAPAPEDETPAPEPESDAADTVVETSIVAEETIPDEEETPAVTTEPEAPSPAVSVPDSSLVPPITTSHTSLTLIDSSQLGVPGAGGDAFQQAIQQMNNKNTDGAIRSLEEALDKGLDPLRQGYVHANLGTLLLKKNDLSGAVAQFMKVLESNQALYESAHDAAQYLNVILAEIGRNEEAALLSQLAVKTQAKLGYSLSPSVADDVRNKVRATNSK